MNLNRLVKASLRTDPGRVRDHNEDFVISREPTSGEDETQNGWLYIVADGVGGADAGEIASQFASESTVKHYVDNHDIADPGERLRESMRSANKDLRQLVVDRGNYARMATTMVAVVIRDQQAYISNVGDSRGYHLRNGEFRQITKDQSLVARLVEEGAITEAEAAVHPRKNVILYSLGSERDPRIDLFEQPLEPSDILLLCSDGLTRHVSDQEISEIISSAEPETAARYLIDLSNKRGGEDNISAAILHFNPKPSAVKKNANSEPARQVKQSKRSMWVLTVVLSLLQTFLIVLVWLLLSV